MGMLRQGVAYVKRDRIPHVHFARAKAEALPFWDALFGAALCGAALHQFANPLVALHEIGRTMKEEAPLVAITYVAGNKGILRFHYSRERLQRDGFHLFEVSDLEQYVLEAGFEDFRSHVYGSMILFNARKRRM